MPPVDLLPGFIPGEEATGLFETLRDTLLWEQKTITLYGKTHDVPRLTCWIGDVSYFFSGITNNPHPWTPELLALRERLETETGASFNSCLANLYRSGADSIGWHADDEPELGPTPTIASISLGSARTFKLRHSESRQVTDFELGHGDLVVMRADSQSNYQHSVPKRARVTEQRINLTFRNFQTR